MKRPRLNEWPEWPSWPTERQWVSVAIIATLWIMLQMAVDNPRLWEVKLFEIILQAIALTGLLNMIVAFHFAANKGDEQKAENTGRAFEAITATAKASDSSPTPDVTLKPGETARAEPASEPEGQWPVEPRQ